MKPWELHNSDVGATVGRKGREGPQQMLTAAQQHAADQFAEGLLALSDDALIDTYHQAADDLCSAAIWMGKERQSGWESGVAA